MDFYTVKTSVDIDTDTEAFNALLRAIGGITQPLIIGDPHPEDGAFLFRFAVRETTLRTHEGSVVDALEFLDIGFTAENTEIILAARI
jgi:hypothetical protein